MGSAKFQPGKIPGYHQNVFMQYKKKLSKSICIYMKSMMIYKDTFCELLILMDWK